MELSRLLRSGPAAERARRDTHRVLCTACGLDVSYDTVSDVLDVVSSTHPDFVEPSRKAAENSIYEPPRRNGEAVKVQFYLPIRFSLID